MMKLLTARLWPLWALLASAFMLAAAHAFERIGGYAPCLLCLRQREVYWTAGGLALLVWALSRWKAGLAGGGSAALGLVFLAGAALAGFHAGVEWDWWEGPAACSSVGSSSEFSAAAVLGALESSQRLPSCDTAPWRLGPLSMAGYNMLVSLGLGLASLLAARRMAP